MNATTLGVVAGVVVFAVGGLHGFLVLIVAIVSWWIVWSACIWLLAQQKDRAAGHGGGKQRKTAGLAELSALKMLVVRQRFAIILAPLLTVLTASLAAHLGDFSGLTIVETAQRAISPLAAFGWVLMVLPPLGLAYWVFIQVDQEARRREAEKAREQQEAARRREAERKAEQERRAEERRRQSDEREAASRREQQAQRAAKQFEETAWWSVLDVSPYASADEIRCAYYRKIKQCHPDRVAGLAPEFIELAERHTRALNTAYDEATRARGASQAA